MKGIVAAVFAAVFCLAGAAGAQTDYPNKPIRLIVPFPPGTAADYVGRLLAEKWSAAWGQPVVIDNVPGAAGTIGLAKLAKSAPDGYTIALPGDAATVVNISLMADLPYDPLRDFAPIMQVGAPPNLLVVNKDLRAGNVAELIALTKAQPGKMSYASSGVGTSQHLGGEFLAAMTGIDIVHVPYKDSYFADLISGRVDFAFANTVIALPQVKSGSVRALAVSSARRAAVVPDLPPVGDTVAGFAVTPWFGLLAPAGTPPAVVAKIHAESARALADPALRAKLAATGFEIIGGTSEEFRTLIASEVPRISALLKSRGLKPQ
jgi:tripartite-type tricarboxylate transporter receptor subunit TctC